MKKIGLLVLPSISIIFFSVSFGAAKSANGTEERPLVAVMPFTYNASTEHAGIEKGLADALAAEMVKTKRFRLVERHRIEDLVKEITLQQSGLVDSATAIKIGKQLSARAYVLGSVVSVSIEDEWRSVKFAEKTTRMVSIEAEAKLVDVETGEMLASSRAVGKSKTAEKHAFGGKVGTLATKEAMIQKALQDLSDKLAKELAKTYSKK